MGAGAVAAQNRECEVKSVVRETVWKEISRDSWRCIKELKSRARRWFRAMVCKEGEDLGVTGDVVE